ncbi:helix-turn-helix domain-containing protein [Streptomyces botrytidirepellens]|nr:helix-turn-helix domain-containing protein [Streptomyces botrytidirepellens]
MSAWDVPRILRWNLALQNMSQQKLAELIDVAPKTVQNWVTGAKKMHEENLDKVAAVLQMTPQFRDLLRELVTKPDSQMQPLDGADPNALQAYLQDYRADADHSPHPAHTSDGAWDVLASNPAWCELMSQVADHPRDSPHVNVMRFVLFHPAAPQVLLDWRRSWLIPMLAHLDTALQLHPDHPVLQKIYHDAQCHPELTETYEQDVPSHFAASNPSTDIVHPDGNVVPIKHPRLGPMTVRMRVVLPMEWAAWGVREVKLIYLDRADCPEA